MITDIILNFLASAALISTALLILWLTALRIKDVSIIDMFWGAGFGFIALFCLALSEKNTPYLLLLTALPILWSIRFTIYMVWRNWGHGEDKRYRALRSNVSETRWPFYALRVVFLNQGLAMLLVAAPLWVALATSYNWPPLKGWVMYPPFEATPDGIPVIGTFSPRNAMGLTIIKPLAIIGTIIWLIGFLFEAVGDWQLARFLARRGKLGAEVTGEIMDKGLWHFSRHPNYFGNALMWWGIWLVACQAPYGWLTIISPIFMTYALIKLTGAAMLEKTMLGKPMGNKDSRPEYENYMARTSMFIPWFPKK